jgi:hypothetical protein
MAAKGEPSFPLYARRNYFSTSGCSSEPGFDASPIPGGTAALHAGAQSPGAGGGRAAGRPRLALNLKLSALDIKPLSARDDSESEIHQAKYKLFEKQCSLIVPGVFLAGEAVARNREQLLENGITHVVNCVGQACRESFKELTYKTYFLQGERRMDRRMEACMHQCRGAYMPWSAAARMHALQWPWGCSEHAAASALDPSGSPCCTVGGGGWVALSQSTPLLSPPAHADNPSEDILAILYDALEFIDIATRGGGRVLVHCSQGVSRSATLVIAFLMWRTGNSFDEVMAQVKAARGVANPNIGERV